MNERTFKQKVLNKDYIESLTGYRPFTSFYEDFSIAESFNIGAIKKTYKEVKKSWKNDYKYWTELIMILNWKMWEHCEDKNLLLVKLYKSLWEDAKKLACENFTDEEKQYYYNITN